MMVSYLSLLKKHNSITKLQGFSSDDSLMYTGRVSSRNFTLEGKFTLQPRRVEGVGGGCVPSCVELKAKKILVDEVVDEVHVHRLC